MTAAPFDLSSRPLPRLGGFNLTLLRIELVRTLTNRRLMVFTLGFPIVLYLLVVNTMTASNDSMGPGVIANAHAYIAVSMALYGAVMAASSAGSSVAVERASGWSRQLRLTPLNPGVYIGIKMVVALVSALEALVATFAVARWDGSHQSLRAWISTAAVILIGSLVFAAFGLFIGYLVPAQNVTQIVGPGLAVLGFLGGLFQGPVDTTSVMGKIQSVTPLYGLAQIAHWPQTETVSGSFDTLKWSWIINVAAWGALFIIGAIWRFRQDTARV